LGGGGGGGGGGGCGGVRGFTNLNHKDPDRRKVLFSLSFFIVLTVGVL
jgi:hypothetical protein